MPKHDFDLILNWLCQKHVGASPAMRMAIEALVAMLKRESSSGG